jgi:hypothetical protein
MDTAEVLERVIRGDVPPPTEVSSRAPRPLESICLKAMAKNPAERYASSRALADDVEKWLADLPVAAHREHPVGHPLRWGRHNKAVVVGSAIFTLTAVIGLALNDYGYRGANIIEITLSCVVVAAAALLALLLCDRARLTSATRAASRGITVNSTAPACSAAEPSDESTSRLGMKDRGAE